MLEGQKHKKMHNKLKIEEALNILQQPVLEKTNFKHFLLFLPRFKVFDHNSSDDNLVSKNTFGL